MRDEGKLETQCWICPICFDDHKFNEGRAFCKLSDLEALRAEADHFKSQCHELGETLAMFYREFKEIHELQTSLSEPYSSHEIVERRLALKGLK